MSLQHEQCTIASFYGSDELDTTDSDEYWRDEYLPDIAELGPAAPSAGAAYATVRAAEDAGTANSAPPFRAAVRRHQQHAATGWSGEAVAAAAAAAERMRLVRLPRLCSLLPHLCTLSLRDMVVSANDLAAAATSCTRLARLEYLVRGCKQGHAHTMHGLRVHIHHAWSESAYTPCTV